MTVREDPLVCDAHTQRITRGVRSPTPPRACRYQMDDVSTEVLQKLDARRSQPGDRLLKLGHLTKRRKCLERVPRQTLCVEDRARYHEVPRSVAHQPVGTLGHSRLKTSHSAPCWVSRRKRQRQRFGSFLSGAVEVLGLRYVRGPRLPHQRFVDRVVFHRRAKGYLGLVPPLERDDGPEAQRSCRLCRHARAQVRRVIEIDHWGRFPN